MNWCSFYKLCMWFLAVNFMFPKTWFNSSVISRIPLKEVNRQELLLPEFYCPWRVWCFWLWGHINLEGYNQDWLKYSNNNFWVRIPVLCMFLPLCSLVLQWQILKHPEHLPVLPFPKFISDLIMLALIPFPFLWLYLLIWSNHCSEIKVRTRRGLLTYVKN